MEPLIFFGILFFIFYFLDRKKISKSNSKQNYEYLKEFLKSDGYIYTPSTHTEYELPDLIYISQVEKKAYLNSPEWKSIKRQRLAIDRYTCQSCNQSGLSLEVHHLHYRTFKSESLSDLVSVCRNCHERQHQYYGFDYNTTFYPLV